MTSLEAGFETVPDLFANAEVDALLTSLAASRRSRAGARHLMRNDHVAHVANDQRLVSLAMAALGSTAMPYRATLFDKSPAANWLVAWHQDTALPLQKRCDTPGWGPWSEKDGIIYAHAPAAALQRVVALRLHLDDSNLENGPLRVIPGSHQLGVLSADAIGSLVAGERPHECVVRRGGVLVMRPLLVHASSKASVPVPRRVLHIEYASALTLDGNLTLDVA